MGHRANFVTIRRRAVTVFEDSYGALGAIYWFSQGPSEAVRLAKTCDKTDELMSWAWAEGGYLIDFDRKVAIVFGFLVPDEHHGPIGAEIPAQIQQVNRALEKSRSDYLKLIAPNWPKWTLIWDEAGVDRFSLYLSEQNIRSIGTATPSDRKLAPPVIFPE